MSLTETISKHPLAIGGAVLAVAAIAYMQSRNAVASSGPTFTGGGTATAQSDPGAVAIQTAQIQAGQQNVSTLAGLLLGENQSNNALTLGEQQSSDSANVATSQSADALTASLANTSATLTSSLAQTEAQRQAAIAQTAAERDAALASTAEAGTVAEGQTAASITIAGLNNSEQLAAANLTAQTQAAQIAAAAAAAKLNADNVNFAIQADKDKARAADNTSIVTGAEHVAQEIIHVFTFGLF